MNFPLVTKILALVVVNMVLGCTYSAVAKATTSTRYVTPAAPTVHDAVLLGALGGYVSRTGSRRATPLSDSVLPRTQRRSAHHADAETQHRPSRP